MERLQQCEAQLQDAHTSLEELEASQTTLTDLQERVASLQQDLHDSKQQAKAAQAEHHQAQLGSQAKRADELSANVHHLTNKLCDTEHSLQELQAAHKDCTSQNELLEQQLADVQAGLHAALHEGVQHQERAHDACGRCLRTCLC
jgi:predicted  nucleic acid-binding Zn-ribbon protein